MQASEFMQACNFSAIAYRTHNAFEDTGRPWPGIIAIFMFMIDVLVHVPVHAHARVDLFNILNHIC